MKVTFDKDTIIYGRGYIAAGDEVDMSEKDVRPHLGRRCHEGWDSERPKPKKRKKKAPKAVEKDATVGPEGDE